MLVVRRGYSELINVYWFNRDVYKYSELGAKKSFQDEVQRDELSKSFFDISDPSMKPQYEASVLGSPRKVTQQSLLS